MTPQERLILELADLLETALAERFGKGNSDWVGHAERQVKYVRLELAHVSRPTQ